jgi:hypothetical protein
MATLIPSLPSVTRKMTSGERRFAQRLESHLEDDYLCWYDVPVGSANVHPDFLVLNPRRGILVLEVKDWKLDSIRSIDKSSVTLLTDRGQTHSANPLEQARQYAHAVCRLFESDPALVREAGLAHQGKLILPWGYGVVLANISRKAFLETDLRNVLPPERVVCQDEMVESVDREAFQKRLWGMFTVTFPCTLSMPQVDRIRWHLFPEIRVPAGQGKLGLEPEAPGTTADQIPDLIRVMDLQQEQLARSLGEGHRVIHGVAGSGKTMILGYRAQYLAQALHKPILVLCYNVALAARLAHLVKERGLTEKISVRNFHGWCYDQLVLYQVPRPENNAAEYWEELVKRVIRGVDSGQIPRAQYGAVLIDEGHDFDPEWLKLVVQMVDPETNSLLVLYDDAQSLYGANKRPRFSFAEVGIQARGRTTVLRLNYRNTAEVLGVAYEFAREVLSPKEAEDDGIPLLAPQSVGRHGPRPELAGFPTLEEEIAYVASRLREFHAVGVAWNDMAVLYRARFMGERISEALKKAGIPVEWLGQSSAHRKYRPADESVKVLTMHSSKGLEFPVVVIPWLDAMPNPREDLAAEAKLLYVAMTRAMENLVMTHHGSSAFVERVDEAMRRAA